MKRIWMLLVLLFLLTGCVATESEDSLVLVSLMPTQGCDLPVQSQRVRSGEDAVFELALEQGYGLSQVDYDGEYEFYVENGKEYLRLREVRYPAKIRLVLTNRFNTICYEPNGGEGTAVERTYDLQLRQRPNTEIGTNLFARAGYTMIGWNTQKDGSGQQIGLGSRVSIPEGGLTLYAQWAPWSDEGAFSYTKENGVTITGYTGDDRILVIPEQLGGWTVTTIGVNAFAGCSAEMVILPKSIKTLEPNSFCGAALRELVIFDGVADICAEAFSNCVDLQTLHINALEPPYGYNYRKESCLADKVDLLIEAQGEKKLVFYGGCSVWYNLDGGYLQQQLGNSYRVINTGVNGVINSALQMQIITAWLEPGDIFFHTPELSSKTQLMSVTAMESHDDKLWCGLELNYDLLKAVDMRCFPNLLDSWGAWLDFRECDGNYASCYEDTRGRLYVDEYGSIPFYRAEQEGPLEDWVYLDTDYLQGAAMDTLERYYDAVAQRGARVYVSYACVNMDAVPPEQRENVRQMDSSFRNYLERMDSAVLISDLADYCYHNMDFYDTNYHLLSDPALRNTQLWLRDLKRQMQDDGIWPEKS